jgi:hypothetical protein
MHKSATKCNETIGKWCKNKHGASKIIDTFETYQTSGGNSPLQQGAEKSFWTLLISDRWRRRIAMYYGKVIGYLGFSRRGVFIGKGASSEVVLVGLTTGGHGPALGHALVVWPTSGSSPSPLRFSESFGKFLDV